MGILQLHGGKRVPGLEEGGGGKGKKEVIIWMEVAENE